MRWAPLWVWAVACTGDPGGRPGGGGGDDDDDDDDSLYLSAVDDTSADRNGIVEVPVDVGPGVRSFQVTGEVDPRYRVGLESIEDPDGRRVLYWEDWWDSRESLTNSVFGFDPVTAVNWPVREADGPLSEGTWTVTFGVTTPDYTYVPDEPITISTLAKRDDTPEEGVVGVQIVWAEGVASDADVVEAVEQAVERWREVWGAHGLQLQEEYVDSSLPANLSFTYKGSDEVADIEKPEGYLRLVVGESIGNDGYTYGVSAGIPGTVQESRSTYVVLSWLVHAGRNGSFEADEISLMGETMAHEVGHYMGLFHPVESNYRSWDALGDTEACTTARDCEAELGDNLMFPYSICDRDGCVAAENMTTEQVMVKQLSIGAL